MMQAEEELKQAHDDLDALDVPREDGGNTLSVSGRILLFASRHRSQIIDEMSYADLRASGGIQNAP